MGGTHRIDEGDKQWLFDGRFVRHFSAAGAGRNVKKIVTIKQDREHFTPAHTSMRDGV